MKKTKSNNDQIAINFSFITNKHFYNYISGDNKSIIDALSSFSSSKKTNIMPITCPQCAHSNDDDASFEDYYNQIDKVLGNSISYPILKFH